MGRPGRRRHVVSLGLTPPCCLRPAPSGRGKLDRFFGDTAAAPEGEGSHRRASEPLRAGLRPGTGERLSREGPRRQGLNPLGSGLVPRREGLATRDARGPVSAASPALLFLCSLPKTQAFGQTKRAGRSRGPEREWGAR